MSTVGTAHDQESRPARAEGRPHSAEPQHPHLRGRDQNPARPARARRALIHHLDVKACYDIDRYGTHPSYFEYLQKALDIILRAPGTVTLEVAREAVSDAPKTVQEVPAGSRLLP